MSEPFEKLPSDPSSDGELVVRAAAGDSQAIASLFTRFWRAARASAYAVVRDMSTAEDVAAEAFCVALPALKRLRDPDRFGPWLRRIVRRVATREAAGSGTRDERRSAATPTAAAPDPEVILERRELTRAVGDAVDRLPGAEREAILLFYFEGYSTEDAARFLGIPVGSLRRRLHDGRNRLRRHLTRLSDHRIGLGRPSPRLQQRLRALAASESTDEDWFAVTREVLLTRPLPRALLTTLIGQAAPPSPEAGAALLTRPRGRIFDDPGPAGEAACALRSALSEFAEWEVDVKAALASFAHPQISPDNPSGLGVSMAPPGLAAGVPGRHIRASRGLLFDAGESDVLDMSELMIRSTSLAAFKQGMQPAWVSDVLDVYCVESRPIELAEIERWLLQLARDVAPSAKARTVPQAALRYRSALRLVFDGDSRPAAIGGVLNRWPAMPDFAHAVHVRIYVEPWAQSRTGVAVAMDPLLSKRPGSLSSAS